MHDRSRVVGAVAGALRLEVRHVRKAATPRFAAAGRLCTTALRYSFTGFFAIGKRGQRTSSGRPLMQCGKYLNQGKLRFMLHCNDSIRLAVEGYILYLWRPAVPPGEVQSVRTGSPLET